VHTGGAIFAPISHYFMEAAARGLAKMKPIMDEIIEPDGHAG
jgi:hypothetical protein